MAPDITSRQNPRVKWARALQQRKHRQGSGQFLVAGLRHVGELAASDYEIEYACYTEDTLESEFARQTLDLLRAKRVPVFSVEPGVFDYISGRELGHGLLAVARQRRASLSDVFPPFNVALINPQDPGNIGAILRTMDAAGAGGLILLDGGATAWHPTAVRASMGTLFFHPVVECSFDEFAAWAADTGQHVYGSSAHGQVDYASVHYESPKTLLLGSERDGLSPEQTAVCQVVVRIPMGGRGTSLNLAVAAGVLMYAMRGK